MIPPKPSLTWEQVTNLEFLTLIETLRGRDDIRTKDWTKQSYRDAARAWVKLQRAREELVTIGTKARRIIASIQDEEDRFKTAMAALQPDYPGLTNYVSTNFQYRRNIHLHLHTKLAQLAQCMPYFGTFMEKPHPQDGTFITRLER